MIGSYGDILTQPSVNGIAQLWRFYMVVYNLTYFDIVLGYRKKMKTVIFSCFFLVDSYDDP